MPNCIVCQKEFESQRTDKLTCSATCRSRLARSVAKKQDLTVAFPVSVATDKPTWKKVFDGEDSGVDIGFGGNDYTREMVDERIKATLKYETPFYPNWYKKGYKSRNEAKEKEGWNRLLK